MSEPATVLDIMERAAFAAAGPDVPISKALEAVTAAREAAQTACGDAGIPHKWLFDRTVHRAGMPSANRYRRRRCRERLITDGHPSALPDATATDAGEYSYTDDYAVATRFAF